MKYMVLFIVVFALLAAFGQKNANTGILKCRAEAQLWNAPTPQQTGALTIHQVFDREDEMTKCVDLDKESDQSAYWTVYGSYVAAESTRELHFIKRHNLLTQFYAEDAKGER